MIPPPLIPVPGFSEPFSCWSHLFAAPVFAVLGWFLIRRGHGAIQRSTLAVYLFCVLFVLCMSGVYHLLEPGSTGRAVMQRLDHAAIFSMIAGTFTALHGILFRGFSRWSMIILMWVIALVGITLKSVFFDSVPESLSLSLYLGMGWIGIISGRMIGRHYGRRLLDPLLAGALAYTMGALLEFARWPILIPGVLHPHELFHVAVLAGIGWHWQAVSRGLGGER